MNLHEEQFDQATELFYEAASLPELWPSALQAVAEAAGAAGATLLPIRKGSNTIVGSPSIRGFLDDFMAGGWLHINPYMKRGLELTVAGWEGLITSENMLTQEQKAKDPYVNEVEAPAGLGPKVGIFLVSRQPEVGLPMTIERHLGAGPFVESEVATLNRFMSRLDAGARLALKVGFNSAVRFADTLAQGNVDFALINGSGQVIYAPPAFEKYLGDGLDLRTGFLGSWHDQTDRALSAAIQRAVQYRPAGERSSEAVPLPRRRSRRPLIARIVPIAGAGQDVFMLARAVILICDPDNTHSHEFIRKALPLMGLTKAEARLAIRIGRGEELRDIAEAEGIAVETARARLKAVFVKTGTNRQAQLALFIASLQR